MTDAAAVADDFNPRSPHGERHGQKRLLMLLWIFQSTLPARGATFVVILAKVMTDDFNPRSPHGERRIVADGFTSRRRHFNPRSPHGERHILHRAEKCARYFNPRSPHGERQAMVQLFLADKPISIHAPRTGSDLAADADVRHFAHISIHAPRTGSDLQLFDAFRKLRISIHAPRTGSDQTAT